MSSVLSSFKGFLNRHRNLSSSKLILGGSCSKLVRKIVTTNIENHRDRLWTNMCYEDF